MVVMWGWSDRMYKFPDLSLSKCLNFQVLKQLGYFSLSRFQVSVLVDPMANHFIIQKENTLISHFSIFIPSLIVLVKVQNKTSLLLVFYSCAWKLGPVLLWKSYQSSLLSPTEHIWEKVWGPPEPALLKTVF